MSGPNNPKPRRAPLLETVQTISWSVAGVLVVAMICAASVYGCTTTNRQFYGAMSECVQAGGSAIPSSGGGPGQSIICLRK